MPPDIKILDRDFVVGLAFKVMPEWSKKLKEFVLSTKVKIDKTPNKTANITAEAMQVYKNYAFTTNNMSAVFGTTSTKDR